MKFTELVESYINSFDQSEVTLIHSNYVVFESPTRSSKIIKKELSKFGYEIEKVGKQSYRFSLTSTPEIKTELIKTLVRKVA